MAQADNIVISNYDDDCLEEGHLTDEEKNTQEDNMINEGQIAKEGDSKDNHGKELKRHSLLEDVIQQIIRDRKLAEKIINENVECKRKLTERTYEE